MPDREKKRVPDDRYDIPKGYLPESSCTPLGHGKSEYLRLNEENEENRSEATRRGKWRSCTRDNVEAGESYFVLNPVADRQPVEIKE